MKGWHAVGEIRLPADYRHWLLNGPGLQLGPRVHHDLDGNWLEEIHGWKPLRHPIDSVHMQDFWWIEYLGTDTDHPDRQTWWRKLVPAIACENGHDMIHFDFLFDAENPPLVLVVGESGGWDAVTRGRRTGQYVAASFTEYLKLTPCPQSDFAPNEHLEGMPVPEPSSRGLAWHGHRDAVLAASR